MLFFQNKLVFIINFEWLPLDISASFEEKGLWKSLFCQKFYLVYASTRKN